MRILIGTLILLIAVVISANAASEAAPWARSIHVAGSDVALFSIDQTRDGGSILAGAGVFASVDALAIKVNASGIVQWARKYGGPQIDIANRIIQTSDGGFVFAGYTDSFGAGRYDAWVVKLSSNGNIVWQNTYGSSWIEQAQAVLECKDGGLFLIGNYQRYGSGGGWDGWCMKLTKTGNVVWRKTFRKNTDDLFADAAATQDGGLLLVGQGQTRSKAWCVRIDATGKTLWQKVYGPADTNTYPAIQVAALAVAPTADGGAVLGGSFGSYVTGEYKGWILKVDSAGNLSWQSALQADDNVQVTAVRQEKDGHVLLVGNVGPLNSTGFDVDSWSARIDPNGEMFWQNAFGKTADDLLPAIHGTADDGTVLAGNRIATAGWDGLVVRTSPDGNTCAKFQSTKQISSVPMNMTGQRATVGVGKSVLMMQAAKAVAVRIKTSSVNLCTAQSQ